MLVHELFEEPRFSFFLKVCLRRHGRNEVLSCVVRVVSAKFHPRTTPALEIIRIDFDSNQQREISLMEALTLDGKGEKFGKEENFRCFQRNICARKAGDAKGWNFRYMWKCTLVFFVLFVAWKLLTRLGFNFSWKI